MLRFGVLSLLLLAPNPNSHAAKFSCICIRIEPTTISAVAVIFTPYISHFRCFVYWRSPSEWGTMIYQWAQSNGLLNTVETFFEILNAKTEFKGMDMPMLLQCVKTLVTAGKAEILGQDGVKFF